MTTTTGVKLHPVHLKADVIQQQTTFSGCAPKDQALVKTGNVNTHDDVMMSQESRPRPKTVAFRPQTRFCCCYEPGIKAKAKNCCL